MTLLKNHRNIDDFCVWSAEDDEYIVIKYRCNNVVLVYPPNWFDALRKITWEMKVKKAMQRELRKIPRHDAKLIIDIIEVG